MRVGFVRNVGLAMLGLAVAVTAACNDDPLSDVDKDAVFDIEANPTVMTVTGGTRTLLQSRAVNEVGEPTYSAVDFVVSPACVTVEPDTITDTVLFPPGRFYVTAGSTIGGCTITLSSGGVTRDVQVNTVADAILILDAPEVLPFGATAQLGASLTASNGTTMGPFDPSEVTWTSDDPAVVSVDETGLVTGLSQGTATIEGCWSGSAATGTDQLGYEICDSASIEVTVPAPTISSASPASGLVGEVITLNMSGLLDPHVVFIDGVELNPIFIESRTETQIVFWFPFFGVGVHEITVGTLAAPSDPVTFELTSEGSGDDPGYLDPGTAPLTALPLKKVAYLSPTVLDHFYLIDLAAPATVVIDADWDSGMDLDILVVDAAFTAFFCTDGATGAQPEQSVCALEAGQWLIWINNYDETTGTYVLTAAIQ